MIDPTSIDSPSGNSPNLFSTKLGNIKMSDQDLNDAPTIIDAIDDFETSTVSHMSTSGAVGDSATSISVSAEADVTDVIARGITALTVVEPTSYEKITPEPEDALSGSTEYTVDGRPTIYVVPGKLREIMREAELYLAGTGRHFQRSASIVVVRTDPLTGESVVVDLHPLALVHALDGVSAWMRYEKRGNTWGQVDPPERICNLMVRVGEFDHLPCISGIARQPYLRPDGSLRQSDGYDPITGLFGIFDSAQYDVPVMPSREQAEQALAVLDDVLSEFDFESPNDRSAALSAMLTAAIRPSLALAPLIHVRAPQIASGKSYLCEILTALATPRRGTPVAFPARDEECTKLLLAQLARSPAVIEFDNLVGDLKPHKSLCTALTNQGLEGRILGHSKVITVGTRTLFLSSGNNVGPVADMTRRCLTIHLNPSCEVPATRAFKRPHLAADVLRQRSVYVSAALTVVRAWIVAGRPTSACPPLANYVEWSDLCRQPLLWLGRTDPAAAIFEAMAEDPDRQTLGLLLSCWHEQFGGDALMLREMLTRTATLTSRSDEFKEVLLDIAGDRDRVSTRKLGQWLRRQVGRVVGGLRLIKLPVRRNSSTWRVESVVSVVSVADRPVAESGVVTEPLAATPL
jgi:hypothetical protein